MSKLDITWPWRTFRADDTEGWAIVDGDDALIAVTYLRETAEYIVLLNNQRPQWWPIIRNTLIVITAINLAVMIAGFVMALT